MFEIHGAGSVSVKCLHHMLAHSLSCFFFLLTWVKSLCTWPACQEWSERNTGPPVYGKELMDSHSSSQIYSNTHTGTHTGRLHFPLSAQICALHKPTRVFHPYDALTRTQQRIWGLFWHEVIDMQRDSRERQANMNSEGQTDKHTAQSLRFRAQRNPSNNSEIKGSSPSSFMLSMVINNQ